MRNVWRGLVACTVVLVALSTTAGAQSTGQCVTKCYDFPTITTVTTWTTYEDCCDALSNPCPPGSVQNPYSWNGTRCPL